jgi:hypothetical protein
VESAHGEPAPRTMLIAQRMMNNDFEPVVGRKFQFRAEPMPNWNGVVDCEVLIVDPFQRLSYNWGVGGSEIRKLWILHFFRKANPSNHAV